MLNMYIDVSVIYQYNILQKYIATIIMDNKKYKGE